MQTILKTLFNFYHFFLSPALHSLGGSGMGCRYKLSCSRFSKASLLKYGVFRGGYMSLKRIGSCHPFGGAR